MLSEVELANFVETTTHYFVTAGEAASVGSPYLIEDGSAPPIQDFTGSIKISGKRRGIIYFTASRLMLTALLIRLGETELTLDNMADLVGEVANTISGNVRRDLGSDFMISPPSVLMGKTETLTMPAGVRPFVTPINWRGHAAQLIVCVD